MKDIVYADIIEATKAGDLQAVESLLAKEPSLIHSKNRFGETPLHWASYNGFKEIVKLLISRGAFINARQSGNETSLHYAKSKEIVKLLITSGADVKARNNSGRTPLHQAESLEVAEMLMSMGADINARDNGGSTPLHCAKKSEVVKLLILKGADINARNSRGESPLRHATGGGQKDVADLLRKHGAKE